MNLITIIRNISTYLANPIKSSWLVLMYASSNSTCNKSCSLATISRSRTRLFTMLSVSSRNLGYRLIYNVSYIWSVLCWYYKSLIYSSLVSALYSYTFSVHLCTTFVNSVTTISTAFSEGCFSFLMYSLTIASKALSGVNRPVL